MRRGSNFERWNNPSFPRNTENWWRRKEIVDVVTTRSGLQTALPEILSSEAEVESEATIKTESELEFEEEGTRMETHEDDPKLGDLLAHLEDDPPTPIVQTEGAHIIEIKSGLLGVLPNFYGLKNEDPYNFLSEFIKICRSKRDPRSHRGAIWLAVLPFSFSGEMNVWRYRTSQCGKEGHTSPYCQSADMGAMVQVNAAGN